MGDVKTADEADKGRLLSELRVAELKVELEKRGLESSGVKVVLSVRLNKALQSEGIDPSAHRFFNVGTAASPAASAARATPKKEAPSRKIEALTNLAEKKNTVRVMYTYFLNYYFNEQGLVETKCEVNDEKKEEDDEEKGDLKIDESVVSNEHSKEEEEASQKCNVKIEIEHDEHEHEEVQSVQNAQHISQFIKVEPNEDEIGHGDALPENSNAINIVNEEKHVEAKNEKEGAIAVEKSADIKEGEPKIDKENCDDENENVNRKESEEVEEHHDEIDEENVVDEDENDMEDEEYQDDEEQEDEDEEEEEEARTVQYDEEMLDDPLNESTRKSATPQPPMPQPLSQTPQQQQQQEQPNLTVRSSTSSTTTQKNVVPGGEVDDGKMRSLWIRGLTAATSAACLKQLCMGYGKVQRAKIFNSRSKKGEVTTCFGYVTFSEQWMSDKCFAEMNGVIVNEKKLTVEKATESTLFDNTAKRNSQKLIDNKFENFKITINNTTENKRESSKERKEREEREKARRERKPIVYKTSPERKKKSPVRSRNGSEPRDGKSSHRRISAAVSSASSRAPRQFITTGGLPMTESLIIRTRVSPASDSIHRSVERGIQNISTSSLRRNKPVVTIPPHSHQSRVSENEFRRREDHTRSRERDREREREKERERERQKEKALEEILRRKEEEHRQRERELELQRERDRIRFEKEKLERERLEFELQKQKMALEKAREDVSNSYSSRGHSDRGESSRYSRESDRRNASSSSSHRDDRSHRDSRREGSSRRRFDDDDTAPPRKMHTDDRDSRRRENSTHIPSSQRGSNNTGNVYGIQSSSSRFTNPINSFGTQDYQSNTSRFTGGSRMMGADLNTLEHHMGIPTAYQSSGPLPTWGGLNANGELDIGNSDGPWNTSSNTGSSARGGAEWSGYDSRGNRQQSNQFYRNGY